MDCGASSSVAEKVSLAPVYSVFMEAPDAQSIKSPPSVGHLPPWLHLHPGASRGIRRSLLLMFTCKGRRSVEKVVRGGCIVLQCPSVWLKSFTCYNSVEVKWIVHACWEQEDGGERGQNLLTKTSCCSQHPSTCTLTQEHNLGSPAICWSVIEVHPCFRLQLTNWN